MSNFEVDRHGGLCCGIRHVHGFGDYDKSSVADFKRATKDAFHTGGRRSCTLVEIVLAEHQDERWHDEAINLGYVQVSKFRNYNTYNECTVYHKYRAHT